MDAVFEDYIYPHLREVADMPYADAQEMSDVCTYVYWAVRAGIELTFEVTDDDFRLCNAAADQFMYDWFVIDDEYWHLGAHELLTLLKEFTNILEYNQSILDQPVIMKYFGWTLRATADNHDSPSLPEFFLLLGHQETLFPLFNALGKYRVSKVPAGAAIFFEFYTTKGEDDLFVKIIFKSEASSED
eukprot:CAMPEP_0176362270 /NCGR_PEP_ID=MMETSP0126-20121128/18313_1 /TAXON_ID=141414 ORGANISM="Strombidinopsis acuminatum, Strain SPMC142" /NCGR_SAMPLE_ID=MMETSP0126 /ASSEMBLY_ACC=CAM_ASM_000229 /LENGTH=186 /DNA_ID=CAMNT_0017718125 /DNA_START=500 /DNA_END=1060 /DNA_ORIENTATION=+